MLVTIQEFNISGERGNVAYVVKSTENEAGKVVRCNYGVRGGTSILGKLMNDPEKAPKVMYAFMQMTKFDIEKLINA